MREQIELKFLIGYAGAPQAAFEAACIEAATRLCGGCFVADGTRYWREGAGRRATRFDGRLQAERTLCLKLTTELVKEAEVFATMRGAIAAAAKRHRMNGAVRWVHVQRSAIVGMHFSIESELEKAA
jgi:hypothetical protein